MTTANTPTEPPQQATGDDGESGSAAPSRRRKAFVLSGVVAIIIALGIAAFAILRQDSSDGAGRAAGALSGNELAQLDSLLTDLPDPPTRLERGRQLMDAGDFSGALDEYLAVLDEGPNAEALAFVGWITFVTGDPILAEHLLEQSLVIEPDYLTAIWFLANVKYFGTEDVAAAVPLLERVVERTDAAPDMIAAAQDLLAAAAESETQPPDTQPTDTEP